MADETPSVPLDRNGKQIMVGDVIPITFRVMARRQHGNGWLIDLQAINQYGVSMIRLDSIESGLLRLVEPKS